MALLNHPNDRAGIAIAVLALFVAAPALAVDPECVGITESAPEIDASDGVIGYCTPSTDIHGTPYPATGFPMSCFIAEAGEILNQADALGPTELVNATFLGLNFDHQIDVYCQNSGGTGETASAVAHFPPLPPGGANFLPGD